MKEKVVIFGGGGFLGSHVADVLSDNGYDVLIYDRERSRYLSNGQREVTGDILNGEQVAGAVRGARFVYNFSGVSDLDECSGDPVGAIRSNVLGHAVISEACAKEKVERLLFASSIYVYSGHGSFYRVSKQSCELMCEAFYEKYGLKYTVLRYGSLYGPRSQPWNGINRYVSQALFEGRIDYPGTGDERREYIYVRDAARLSVDVLKDEFENQSVIITGTQTFTSREITAMIGEILGGDITIKFIGKAPDYHYVNSPYNFSPKVARKLVSNLFVDIGQGIVKVAEEIHSDTERCLYAKRT